MKMVASIAAAHGCGRAFVGSRRRKVDQLLIVTPEVGQFLDVSQTGQSATTRSARIPFRDGLAKNLSHRRACFMMMREAKIQIVSSG